MSTNWDTLIENHFAKKKERNRLTLKKLLETVTEVMEESSGEHNHLLTERAPSGGRFSMSIPIPKLVPTEAWGDPSSQSRKDIERIFASITRQPSIKARIEHVNSFLDPEQAIRKAPGGKVNAVLNMMQIIEALQAALNDYNDRESDKENHPNRPIPSGEISAETALNYSNILFNPIKIYGVRFLRLRKFLQLRI